jgi:hypothetical protein
LLLQAVNNKMAIVKRPIDRIGFFILGVNFPLFYRKTK